LKKNLEFGFWIMFAVLLIPVVLTAAVPPSQFETVFNQGLAAFHAGNADEALVKWQEGLTLAEQNNARTMISAFSANIGLAYASRGEYDNALLYYEKALLINRETKDQKNAAINLNNIGAAYKNTGKPEKALEYYNQALVLRRETKDRKGEANTLNNMGLLLSDSGQYKDAFKNINEALFIYRDIRDQRGEADALIHLGVAYTTIGQFDQAIEAYQKASDINLLMHSPRKQAQIAANMGTVHLLREDYQKAIDSFTEALKIHRNIPLQNEIASDLSNLGVAYKGTGDFKKALTHYEEALLINRSMGDRPNEGAILGNIGLVQEASGDYKEALKNLIQSHQICMASDLPEYQWRALRGLGKVEARLEKFDNSILHYKQSIDIIEKIRDNLAQKETRASFMQSKTHVYDELIELYMALHPKDPSKGYDRQSFDLFERKQGRVFLEEMGKSGVRNFSGISPGLIEKQTKFTNERDSITALIEKESTRPAQEQDLQKIKNLKEKIEIIDNQLRMLEDTIKKEYPDYYALKYPQPVDVNYLQKFVLSPREIMLVYNIMQNDSCVWAIGKDYFSMARIDKGAESLADAVTAFRDQDINYFKGQTLRGQGNAPESSPSGKSVSDASKLYQTLFPEPVTRIIKNYSTVYIVPTGSLYLLPFEALKNEAHQYLIETHSFAYLSSASLLNVLRASQGRLKTEPAYPFLAFANPVYEVPPKSNDVVDDLQVRSFYNLMRGNIEPLPETEDEVTRIKNILLAPDSSNPLQTQKNASCSKVFDFNSRGSLDDYRYISFACHGVIPDQTNGITQPSLLLSTPDPVTQKIGLLTMTDAFGLKFNADLVALSACNTGRGEVVNGEGVMGLTRAFMYAGTPTVSVNLWSVESISAQKLSVSFFSALQQGASRAEALRASKLKLIHGEEGSQFQQPFFWAPMVIFGDGS